MNSTKRLACSVLLGAALLGGHGAGVTVAKAAQAVPGAATATTLSAAEQAALTRGRALMQAFYAVNLGALWQAFTPAVQGQWGSLAGFTAFRQQGVRQYGAERQVVRERAFTRAGEVFYVRSATFQQAPGLVWALIVGFQGTRISTFGITLEDDRSSDPVAWNPRP